MPSRSSAISRNQPQSPIEDAVPILRKVRRRAQERVRTRPAVLQARAPAAALHLDKPRGRTSHGRPPTLPDGWLNDPDELVHVELEDAFSGG